MWTEFEWENKISINTNIKDVRQFLNHFLKSTNMSCLTPDAALAGDCGFLSANLYARSIFGMLEVWWLMEGEDALANISLEQHDDAPISGHVRIRSKTQGIALSLGDKITLTQKVKDLKL
jgi:coatomer subunit beta